MARLQDFQTVTPTSSDKLLVVQSQGQGLVPYGSKLDSANPTGTGSLNLNGTASGGNSVAIGQGCTASGSNSFASGRETIASNNYSHAEGYQTIASGDNGSHAEGIITEAKGRNSHAEGQGTIAGRRGQHCFGEYNIEETGTATTRGTYVEIVGNGSNTSNRSNARTLDWLGNEVLAGDCTIKGNKSLDAVTTKHAITITAEQGVASNVAVTGGEINGLVAFMAQLRVTASANAWTDIATINYKPSITFSGLVLRNGTGTPNGMIQILSSGVVRIFPTSALSTNDVSFVACYST